MLSGRKVKWDQLRARLSFEVTEDSAGTFYKGWGATLFSEYVPNTLVTDSGIILSLEAANGPMSPYRRGRVQIPLFGIDADDTDVYADSSELTLEIDGFLLIIQPYAWEVRWSALRVRWESTIIYSEGARDLIVGANFVPAGVPLLGIPFTMGGNAALNPVPIAGAAPDCEGLEEGYVNQGRVNGKVSGGWEYRENPGDDFQALPVSIEWPAYDPEACDCAEEVPDFGAFSVTSTMGGEIEGGMEIYGSCELLEPVTCDECTTGPTAPFTVYPWKGTSMLKVWGGGVMLLPDLPKSVKRWKNHDYAMLVERGGMPRVRSQAAVSCGTWGPGSMTTVPTFVETHPEQSAILSLVRDSTHAIEDTFGYATVAPASKSRSVGRAVAYGAFTVGPIACPLGDPEEPPGTPIICWVAPPSEDCYYGEALETVNEVQERTGTGSNPDMLPYLDHVDPRPRYINYWANPHWSYWVWFPPNTIDTDEDEIPDAQDQWPVFGVEAPVEYWLKIRQQWLDQSALPVGERPKTRNVIGLEPLYHGSLSPYVYENLAGCDSAWWGDQSFLVDEWLPPSFVKFDQRTLEGGLVTPEDCSVSMDADTITVNPDAGETEVAFQIRLGSFEVFPFKFPCYADEFEFGWNPANIEAIRIFLVSSRDGAKVLITEEPGRFKRPLGVDTRFGFSYAQDYGQGIYVGEEGEDLDAAGDSAALMADAGRNMAFGLLGGRTALYLRFEITVTDPDVDVVLDQVGMYPPSTVPLVLDENAFQQIILWEEGPGIRFGNWGFYYSPGGLHAIPQVYNPGYPPDGWHTSILDWMCTKRLLGAQAHDLNLTSELESLFMRYTEWAAFANLDSLTLSLLLENPTDPERTFPVGVMVPTFRSCPPLACFPIRARDAHKQPTGVPAQEAWSHSEERRFYAANERVDLWSLDATPVRVTDLLFDFPDFKVTSHKLVLDNDEGRFTVRKGSKELGRMRPWHGVFGVTMAGRVWNCISSDRREELGLILEAGATNDGIYLIRYNLESPQVYGEFLVAEVAEPKGCPRVKGLPNGAVWVIWEKSGTVYESRSFSFGERWTDPVSLGISAIFPAPGVSELLGVEMIVGHASGKWRCWRRLAEDEAFAEVGEIFTQASGDAKMEGFVIAPDRSGVGVATFVDAGSLRRFVTTTLGETWEEI